MDAPEPPPLPLAHKVVIPPTTDAPPHRTADCPPTLPPYEGESSPPVPPSVPNSLDTQESSVRRDFDRWLHEKHQPEELFYAPALDELSSSARFRHSGWSKIRRWVWESLVRTQQPPARRRAFGECGSYSWVQQNSADCFKFRIRHNHCHDRLCTPCANARSQRIQEALLALIGGNPVSFITLTLCGKGEPLGDLVDRLYKHFRALRVHPLWEEAVTGGAAFLEIKWSDKAQRWHPHLHIIADAKYIEQGFLTKVWHGISRDSYIVDIRRVRQPNVTAHYVTKYASKPLNSSFMNTSRLLDEAVRALKGRRLCLCFGTWYGTPLDGAEDELLEEGIEDEKWLMFSDLETLLQRANAGDREARNVIFLAGGEVRWRQSLLDSS